MDDFEWLEVLEGGLPRSGISNLRSYARSRKHLTRDELLAESGGQRALDLWWSGDDSLFLSGEALWRRERDENTVRVRADEGCTVARAIVDRGLDLGKADRYIDAHFCSDACGGRPLVSP